METEREGPEYSDRERKIIRIRMQLKQNEMFMAGAGKNEGMKKILDEQREKLERELAELERGEKPIAE